MKTTLLFGLMALLLLTGCADRPEMTCQLAEGVHAHAYGFWGGLWHGIIVPFAALAMIFYDDVAIYAPVTNGAWYHTGFVTGSGGIAVIVKLIKGLFGS